MKVEVDYNTHRIPLIWDDEEENNKIVNFSFETFSECQFLIKKEDVGYCVFAFNCNWFPTYFKNRVKTNNDFILFGIFNSEYEAKKALQEVVDNQALIYYLNKISCIYGEPKYAEFAWKRKYLQTCMEHGLFDQENNQQINYAKKVLEIGNDIIDE